MPKNKEGITTFCGALGWKSPAQIHEAHGQFWSAVRGGALSAWREQQRAIVDCKVTPGC